MVLAMLLSALGWFGADTDESHTLLHGSLVLGRPTLQAGGLRVDSHVEVPLRFSPPVSVPAGAATSRRLYAEMIEIELRVVRHDDEHGHVSGLERRRMGSGGADAAGEYSLVFPADGSSGACSTGRCGCSTGSCRDDAATVVPAAITAPSEDIAMD